MKQVKFYDQFKEEYDGDELKYRERFKDGWQTELYSANYVAELIRSDKESENVEYVNLPSEIYDLIRTE